MEREKFLEKVNSLDDNSRKLSYNFFTKQKAITGMLDMVMEKKKIVRNHIGNYNAKVCFVVNFDTTNDKIIDIIKKFYAQNNANFYSLYITSIDKFNERVLDLSILKKEIEILSPKRVIILGDDVALDIDSISLNKEDLDILITCLNDKEQIVNYPSYENVKNQFINCIKFALFGKQEE